MIVQTFSRFCSKCKPQGEGNVDVAVTYHERDSNVLGVTHNATDHVDALLKSPVLGLAYVREDMRIEDGGVEAFGVEGLDEVLTLCTSASSSANEGKVTTYENLPRTRFHRPRLIARVLARREALPIRAILRVEGRVNIAHSVEKTAHEAAILLVSLWDSSVVGRWMPSREPNGGADGSVRLEEHAICWLEVFVEVVGALGVGELYYGG